MAVGARPVVSESSPLVDVEVTGKLVISIDERRVCCPAHLQRVEDEAAEIEVTVRVFAAVFTRADTEEDLVVSGLERPGAESRGCFLTPGATQHGDVCPTREQRVAFDPLARVGL